MGRRRLEGGGAGGNRGPMIQASMSKELVSTGLREARLAGQIYIGNEHSELEVPNSNLILSRRLFSRRVRLQDYVSNPT